MKQPIEMNTILIIQVGLPNRKEDQYQLIGKHWLNLPTRNLHFHKISIPPSQRAIGNSKGEGVAKAKFFKLIGISGGGGGLVWIFLEPRDHFSCLDSFDADLAALVLKKLKEGKSVQVELDILSKLSKCTSTISINYKCIN